MIEITDGMVEAGARALARRLSHEGAWDFYWHEANALIAAVAPLIRAAALEEAAKVADAVMRSRELGNPFVEPGHAIRALAQESKP